MTDKEKQDALLREYQEIGNNLRHYGNFRIGRLAMFFTLNAALLAAREDVIQPRLRGAVGVAIAILFWIADMHIRRTWGALRDRGAEIDEVLELQQYKRLELAQSGPRQKRKGWRKFLTKEFYISSTFSTRATIFCFFLLWITRIVESFFRG